mmetsp:Transcript_1780/g.2654  ORF Transcript_1780/g.2654 Transcript_1780/m.2654 type:complete len:423 (+) Transcript_1780:123-1391(+)|eukprot:CAMPEP_0195511120 /NCGR_PEP_ID=MMETSP0794_2-20130614/3559_1 /TAXON_ID=515487 /ORGANISM="Stephanopyxis turris, Strain CCMP 815" /LENGTH=422 /DNA_ID=CAMNT_0040638667 /DNA_START=123 /DNA_END=1391 /DNA_ORIENTATION=-
MQASRIILTQTSTSSSTLIRPSALRGLKIAPRSPFGILASASQAAFSFFQSDNRDKYLNHANANTINPQILGIPLSLALFSEMEFNPLLEEHKFKVDEYAVGFKVALEKFHDLQFELQGVCNENEVTEDSEVEEDVNASILKTLIRDETVKATLAEMKQETKGEKDVDTTATASEEITSPPPPSSPSSSPSWMTPIPSSILQDDEKMEQFAHKLTDQWTSTASSDPSSLPGQLYRMVTPEYFNELSYTMNAQMMAWKTTDIKSQQLSFENWTSTVTNLDLLSVRAIPVPPTPKTDKEELEALTDEQRDKNDDLLNNIPPMPEEEQFPVICQTEVLYQIETSFTVKSHDKDVMKRVKQTTSGKGNDVWTDGSSTGDASHKQEEKEGEETVTQTAAVVGVFEGWIHGNGGLRWKLAWNRPFYGI